MPVTKKSSGDKVVHGHGQQNVGHLWRRTGDITKQWEGVKSMGNWHALDSDL